MARRGRRDPRWRRSRRLPEGRLGVLGDAGDGLEAEALEGHEGGVGAGVRRDVERPSSALDGVGCGAAQRPAEQGGGRPGGVLERGLQLLDGAAALAGAPEQQRRLQAQGAGEVGVVVLAGARGEGGRARGDRGPGIGLGPAALELREEDGDDRVTRRGLVELAQARARPRLVPGVGASERGHHPEGPRRLRIGLDLGELLDRLGRGAGSPGGRRLRLAVGLALVRGLGAGQQGRVDTEDAAEPRVGGAALAAGRELGEGVGSAREIAAEERAPPELEPQPRSLRSVGTSVGTGGRRGVVASFVPGGAGGQQAARRLFVPGGVAAQRGEGASHAGEHRGRDALLACLRERAARRAGIARLRSPDVRRDEIRAALGGPPAERLGHRLVGGGQRGRILAVAEEIDLQRAREHAGPVELERVLQRRDGAVAVVGRPPPPRRGAARARRRRGRRRLARAASWRWRRRRRRRPAPRARRGGRGR